MKKLTLVATIACTIGLAAGVAFAAPGWVVFARGVDTSPYYPSASANADAPKSKALAIRAISSTHTPVKITFSLICNGEARVQSGVEVVLTVAASKKCMVGGFASQDGGGTVRVELLRR